MTPFEIRLLILSEMIDDPRFADYVDDKNRLARAALAKEVELSELDKADLSEDFEIILNSFETSDFGFGNLDDLARTIWGSPEPEYN